MRSQDNYSLELDILKGICIILVVIGHSGSIFTHYIYLFHVGVFFIASGYVYKQVRTWGELKRYVLKRVKRLYLPYVGCNLFFLIINNWLVSCNIYDTTKYISFKALPVHIIKILCMIENSELLGAAWFLRVLFLLSVIYSFFDFCIDKLFDSKNVFCGQLIMSIALHTIGYLFWKYDIIGGTIGTYFIIFTTIYILYFIGTNIRGKMGFVKDSKIAVICAIVASLLLLIIGRYETLEIGRAYGVFGIFIVSVCMGWMFLWAISFIIKQSKRVANFFRYLGRKTIYILLFHFVGFKFVIFMQIKMLEKPISYLASFPIYLDGWSWLYTVSGIVFSVSIAVIVENSVRYYSKVKLHGIE